jgi:uncharacterized Zn-finger protein
MADVAVDLVVEMLSKYDPATGRFLVKWTGKAETLSTWEVEENLAQDLVLAWDANGGFPATTSRASNFGVPSKCLSSLSLAWAVEATALAAAVSKQDSQGLRSNDVAIAAISTRAIFSSTVVPATAHSLSTTISGADGTSEKKKFVCGWKACNKTFSSASSRKRHTRSHTGEKPFACSWKSCLYRSAQSGNLKAHFRTHTKEKPFPCSWLGCDFRSSDQSNLKTHLQIHTAEVTLVCREPNCGFSAVKHSTLKRHAQTHTDQKLVPFKHGVVLATARSSVHGDEKPFVCSFEGCTYRAVTSNHIAQHSRAHAGENPFICGWEGCRFRTEHATSLRSHTRMHTGLQLARMALFGCSKADCAFLGTDSKSLAMHLEGHAASPLALIHAQEKVGWF